MNMTTNKSLLNWRKKATKRYEFYVHKESEKGIFEWLEAKDNKRQYILELIEKDMKKNGKKV